MLIDESSYLKDAFANWKLIHNNKWTFQKKIDEWQADYVYNNGLIRNYINLVLHEAIMLQPSKKYGRHQNAASRLASVFLKLLK